jgi:hypothetical protein
MQLNEQCYAEIKYTKSQPTVFPRDIYFVFEDKQHCYLFP